MTSSRLPRPEGVGRISPRSRMAERYHSPLCQFLARSSSRWMIVRPGPPCRQDGGEAHPVFGLGGSERGGPDASGESEAREPSERTALWWLRGKEAIGYEDHDRSIGPIRQGD